MTSTLDVLSSIFSELERAESKFRPFNSLHEGASVIREEFEEFWDAVKANDTAEALREAVHLCAMATRFIKDISSNKNPLSLSIPPTGDR